jgi:hypothetical protein
MNLLESDYKINTDTKMESKTLLRNKPLILYRIIATEITRLKVVGKSYA